MDDRDTPSRHLRTAVATTRDAESVDRTWLDSIAAGASRDAGGVPAELLGDYLLLLADAATYGRKSEYAEIEPVTALAGRQLSPESPRAAA